MSDTYDPYQDVLQIIEDCAKECGYERDDYIALSYPERELKVAIPIEMDDGSIQVLKAIVCSIPLHGALPKAESAITRMSTLTK